MESWWGSIGWGDRSALVLPIEAMWYSHHISPTRDWRVVRKFQAYLSQAHGTGSMSVVSPSGYEVIPLGWSFGQRLYPNSAIDDSPPMSIRP
mmetsp:Transcript_1784/g.3256  ORF Transcript_1784/g.3256 Transcript_1784/m.3256 type:complete len:92 (-) Transcript_1784:571-846(-)